MKFKVGDRVRVYLGGAEGVPPGFEIGVISYIKNTDIVVEYSSTGQNWHCHPKQLRRLKHKVKKPEPPKSEYKWMGSIDVHQTPEGEIIFSCKKP